MIAGSRHQIFVFKNLLYQYESILKWCKQNFPGLSSVSGQREVEVSRFTNTRVSFLRNTHFNYINIFSFSLRGNQVKKGTPNRGVKKRRNSFFLLLNLSSFLHHFLDKNIGPSSKQKIHITLSYCSERSNPIQNMKIGKQYKQYKVLLKRVSNIQSRKILEISKTTYQIEAFDFCCNIGFQSVCKSACGLGLVNLRVLSLRACLSLQRKMLVQPLLLFSSL